jgi:hypothetical protein
MATHKRNSAEQSRHSEPASEHRIPLLLVAVAILAAPPAAAQAGLLADAGDTSGTAAGAVSSTTPPHLDVLYTRPAQRIKARTYLFDAFGPYPIVGAALAAGVSQAKDIPPGWHEGAEGYGRRIGSNLGIAAVTTTTRYGLAEAFKEDTLYYRCDCKGVLPRLRHAVISTLTARRGEDGHRVFSIPALVAPYAGTMTAIYAWYPGRYSAEDALRMGNYNLLANLCGNIALEFVYAGPHSLLTRMHLNNGHGAPGEDPGNPH